MILGWDGYRLDPNAHRLTGPDGDVHLEPQAFDVLVALIEDRHRIVSKEELLDSVWGDQFVSESALTTRIKQVRRALGDDGRTQKYIRNVHGRGYQFVGVVDPSESASTSPSDSTTPSSANDAVIAERVVRAVPRPVELGLDIAVDTEFPFVGRVDEMERAGAVLTAENRRSAQIFVGGPPGVGKSRFAVEITDRAAQSGSFVCAGRCEASVTSGLQAVRDAFAQLAAHQPDRVERWTRGIEGPLMSMIPSLVDHLSNEPTPVDAYAGIDVFVTTFERVARDGPLVLLIDDLQWSDDPTRTFLGRLHRRLRDLPVTTVSTFRSGRADLPTDVYHWIQQQQRSPDTVDVVLEDLAVNDAENLVHSVLGDTGELHELVAVTAGNCLFLTESLRDVQLGQRPSESVADLIASRVERQPDRVQDIVRAGALLGPEFSFAVAAAAAGLESAAALDAIEMAIDAELLHETASAARFRFSHQLVPQAIVDTMSKSTTAAVHRACAAALEDDGADDVEVAFHLLGAVPIVALNDAIDRARAAVRVARAGNQFDRALRLISRMLATGPSERTSAELLLEHGEILNRKGLPGEAIDVLEQVAAIARTNGWPDLFVGAALAHWSQSPFRKPEDRSTLALLAEADLLLGDTPSISKAKVIAKTAVFNVFLERLSVRAAATQRAIDMSEVEGATPLDRLELLEARHITFSCAAGASELSVLTPEIEALRIATSSYFNDAAAPETTALMHGDGEEFRRVSRADADRMAAQPIAEWRDLVLRSTLAAFDGDIASARELCDLAAEIGGTFWGDSSPALHGYAHFFFDLLSDDWTRSHELLAILAAFSPVSVFTAPLAVSSLRTAGAEVDPAMVADEDIRRWMTLGEHILGGNRLVACAELALTLDDDELARAAETALLPYQHLVLGLPWAASLAAADPLARLAERRGDDTAAAEHRAVALDLYQRLDAPTLIARLD